MGSLSQLTRRWRSFFCTFRKATRGAVAPLTAILLLPILGATALAVDVGYWYKVQRDMQSAADSAALAAAGASDANYAGMAVGTAAKMGFTNGTSNVVVASARGTTYCPSGSGTCTQVTISGQAPLFLSKIVGYLGNGAGGQALTAAAVASSATSGPSSLCITALGTSSTAISANGVPFANLTGCSMFSNGGMNCNGHDMGADYAVGVGTVLGCGVKKISGATALSDPYSSLASQIPKPACQSSNTISGNKTWTGPIRFCGDVSVAGDVTLLAGSNAVIVIDNGTLNLNKNTFKTASGAGATLIFTGTNASSSLHYPTGANGGNPGATLDIAAPTSGTWSGIALYQDPNLTNNVSFTYAGNAPTWNISGLVYLPNSNFQVSGAIGKASNGASCIALVTKTITINGTGALFANPQSQCSTAGLTPPSSGISGGLSWLVK